MTVKINMPKILIISDVLPFPGTAGQQQRVFYTLKALRERFQITFLTTAPRAEAASVQEKLLAHCDEAIVLPARYPGSLANRFWHKAAGTAWALAHGLKFSNYLVSRLEYTPARILSALGSRTFDFALFEYWHAHTLVPHLQSQGVRCILDTHNILWQSYSRQLDALPWLSVPLKRWFVHRYQRQEEAAWAHFDTLITINRAEHTYLQTTVSPTPSSVSRLLYLPMGIDLTRWPSGYTPASPPRLAYYGGLGSAHNQQDALTCYRDIMPLVWAQRPDAELWLVGSSPPPFLQALPAQDGRVHVTGFVENVQPTLAAMTAILCPWSGTYGFRSRLVEALALGVPVIASPDAVYGMDFVEGQGLLFAQSPAAFATHALALLADPALARTHSQHAVSAAAQYSFDATYGQLPALLLAPLRQGLPSTQSGL